MSKLWVEIDYIDVAQWLKYGFYKLDRENDIKLFKDDIEMVLTRLTDIFDKAAIAKGYKPKIEERNEIEDY